MMRLIVRVILLFLFRLSGGTLLLRLVRFVLIFRVTLLIIALRLLFRALVRKSFGMSQLISRHSRNTSVMILVLFVINLALVVMRQRLLLFTLVKWRLGRNLLGMRLIVLARLMFLLGSRKLLLVMRLLLLLAIILLFWIKRRLLLVILRRKRKIVLSGPRGRVSRRKFSVLVSVLFMIRKRRLRRVRVRVPKITFERRVVAFLVVFFVSRRITLLRIPRRPRMRVMLFRFRRGVRLVVIMFVRRTRQILALVHLVFTTIVCRIPMNPMAILIRWRPRLLFLVNRRRVKVFKLRSRLLVLWGRRICRPLRVWRRDKLMIQRKKPVRALIRTSGRRLLFLLKRRWRTLFYTRIFMGRRRGTRIMTLILRSARKLLVIRVRVSPRRRRVLTLRERVRILLRRFRRLLLMWIRRVLLGWKFFRRRLLVVLFVMLRARRLRMLIVLFFLRRLLLLKLSVDVLLRRFIMRKMVLLFKLLKKRRGMRRRLLVVLVRVVRMLRVRVRLRLSGNSLPVSHKKRRKMFSVRRNLSTLSPRVTVPRSHKERNKGGSLHEIAFVFRRGLSS